MTKLSEGRIKNVFNLLEDIKVFTLERLMSSLSCSIPTARLKLKQWGRLYIIRTGGIIPCLRSLVLIITGCGITRVFILALF